jgi:phosphoribosylaminoimidazole-succinocarboxamide synthase
MANLSPARAGESLVRGLDLLSRGKVRDTYNLANGNLLARATNGISIFDFVLNALVPEKGMILNAMNHFWLMYLSQFGFKTHFVAAGSDIDDYLPEHQTRNTCLQSTAIVVRKLSMAPVEFIARAVLTGSAVKSYQQNLEVCGHKLQSGLQDGDALACFLDTPTTKAEVGHDENLSATEVRQKYPGQTYTLLQVFQIASQYAEQKGIKLADTKLEFGQDGTIADEILTPDSSRFWEYSTWLEGRKIKDGRKAPPPYDKQLVRAWGIEQGVNKLDPVNPDHVAKVHSLKVPQELIKRTTQVYRYIFWRLTGLTIEKYLQTKMGVQVSDHRGKSIAIICGSKSDVPAVQAVQNRDLFTMADFAKVETHVMSCHRNPNELKDFAREKCSGLDAIICIGSKAFALPGVLDAHLHAAGIPVPVIGVALGEPGSVALEAAKLSIEELPGQPVLMDEMMGKCWVGSEGLTNAMIRVARGELPPPKPRVNKPVEMNVIS